MANKDEATNKVATLPQASDDEKAGSDDDDDFATEPTAKCETIGKKKPAPPKGDAPPAKKPKVRQEATAIPVIVTVKPDDPACAPHESKAAASTVTIKMAPKASAKETASEPPPKAPKEIAISAAQLPPKAAAAAPKAAAAESKAAVAAAPKAVVAAAPKAVVAAAPKTAAATPKAAAATPKAAAAAPKAAVAAPKAAVAVPAAAPKAAVAVPAAAAAAPKAAAAAASSTPKSSDGVLDHLIALSGPTNAQMVAEHFKGGLSKIEP